MNHITKSNQKNNTSLTKLKRQVSDDSNPFRSALEYCLQVAKYRAQAELEGNLFATFNNTYLGNGWPLKVDDYIQFLELFFDTSLEESMETPEAIYNRAYHFHWLINQPIKFETYNLLSLEQYNFSEFNFAHWLDSYIQEWQHFLNANGRQSPTQELIQCFNKIRAYNKLVASSYINNWMSLSEFTSQVNTKNI